MTEHAQHLTSGNACLLIGIPSQARGVASRQAVHENGILNIKKIDKTRHRVFWLSITSFALNLSLFAASLTLCATAPAKPLASAGQAEPPLYLTPMTVNTYDKIEIAMNDKYNPPNPYDYDKADIYAIFTAPDGMQYRANAFYYQGWTRQDSKVSPAGHPQWRVRFSPIVAGNWKVKMAAHVNGNSESWDLSDVTVNAADNKGFLQVSKTNPRVFEFANGAPFFPIGINLFAFAGEKVVSGKPLSADRAGAMLSYMDKTAAGGGNFARVLLHSLYEPLDLPPNTITGFAGPGMMNQQVSWEIDQVMDNAQKDKMYLLMCVENANTTANVDYYIKTHNTDMEAKAKPFDTYSAANGGPVTNSADMFTNAGAIKDYKEKLRYVVARYGYSQYVTTIQLFNELQKNAAPAGDIISWCARMADYVKGCDPYHRMMVSNSYLSSAVDWDHFDAANSHMDFYDYHRYVSKNAINYFKDSNTKLWSRTPKPIFVTEFGTQAKWRKARGGDGVVDPAGRSIHEDVWTIAMTGGAGGLVWFVWSYVDPLNLYDVVKPYSIYVRDWNINKKPWKPMDAPVLSSPNYGAQGMTSGDEARVWVYNVNGNHYNLFMKEKPIETPDASLTLNMPDGGYIVKVFDTYRGVYTSQNNIIAAGGHLTIPFHGTASDFALTILNIH